MPPHAFGIDVPAVAMAHRGGAGTGANIGIENTLAAFADAVARGFRYLETDVRCSADGTVWTIHDERLDRLSLDERPVARLTDQQIAENSLDGREPPARLVDVLRTFPDVRLNIDVKADDAVEPTCRLLRDEHAVDRVCLASFSHRRIRRVRRLLPEVTTAGSSLEVALVAGAPARVVRILGRGWWAPDCLQVPVSTRGVPVTTRRFVRRAHRLGRPVHVWTVDDAAEMHRLLDLGVDGLITDRTDVLVGVLAARGTPLEESPA